MAEAAPAEGEAPAGDTSEVPAEAAAAEADDVSMEDVLGQGTRKRPAAKAESDPVESKTY